MLLRVYKLWLYTLGSKRIQICVWTCVYRHVCAHVFSYRNVNIWVPCDNSPSHFKLLNLVSFWKKNYGFSWLSNWSCNMPFALVYVRTVLIYGNCFSDTNGTSITKFAPKPNSHVQVPQLILFFSFSFSPQGSKSFRAVKAQLIVNILSSVNVISVRHPVTCKKLALWTALWYGELITDELMVWWARN